jgi:hypothetical protein
MQTKTIHAKPVKTQTQPDRNQEQMRADCTKMPSVDFINRPEKYPNQTTKTPKQNAETHFAPIKMPNNPNKASAIL